MAGPNGPASSIPGLDCSPSHERRPVAMGVIIIREMVGRSPNSWSDAARRAVETAAKTVRNIQTVEVVKSTAEVRDGEIVEYRVDLKIGFEYEG
jgi:dodecin